jgi:predicted metal-dependent hydrolase
MRLRYTSPEVEAPKEPDLTPEERASLSLGVRQFNDGYYFECHDTLEDLWSGVRGESRDFFQGLIQVAVAFYHLGNGNPAGASSMLERALARLGKYGSSYLGLDLKAHCAELRAWRHRIQSGEAIPVDFGTAPRWDFGKGILN